MPAPTYVTPYASPALSYTVPGTYPTYINCHSGVTFSGLATLRREVYYSPTSSFPDPWEYHVLYVGPPGPNANAAGNIIVRSGEGYLMGAGVGFEDSSIPGDFKYLGSVDIMRVNVNPAAQRTSRMAFSVKQADVTKQIVLDSDGNFQFFNLPSVAPAAGSKKCWYDPAAGNVVKFVP
jgi:hypothetical protein